MRLAEFKAQFTDPFPGCSPIPTTPFGLDAKTFPGQPREHPFVDLALPAEIEKWPYNYPVRAIGDAVNGTKWWGAMDDLGTTYLDLRGEGWTFRIAHFIKHELDDKSLVLIDWGHALQMGDIIGPAGNAGRVASNGGSGRHIHAGLMLEPGRFDSVLTEKWGDFWKASNNKIPTWISKCGSVLEIRLKKNGWMDGWMNEFAGGRIDPWTKKPVVMVNWYALLS